MIKNVILILVMIIYLLIPYYLISENQTTLTDGEVFRLRPRPVDPYDAFRGKYLTLSFINQGGLRYSLKEGKLHEGETVYIEMKRDENGDGIFGKISPKEPEETENYISAEVSYEWNSGTNEDSASVSVNLPFSRYYLPEEMAPEAEKIYNQSLRRNRRVLIDSVYVDVRVKKGKAIIEEFYIDGIPVKDYVRLHSVETE